MDLFEIRRAEDGGRQRIPGLLVSGRGTLLMYNEARRGSSDWAPMDIVLVRSCDGGATLGPVQVIARGSEELPTVNNPVMVEDRLGRIHFLYCENYGVEGGRIMRRTSLDDGLTWSGPDDITRFTRPGERNVFALGPGHGIRSRQGLLLIPFWEVPKSFGAPLRAHGPSVTGVLFSRDEGETWERGETIGAERGLVSPNEASLAELPGEEGFYMTVRCADGRRAAAYSPDGHGDWYGCGPAPGLVDPVCFGSVAAWYPKGPEPALLFVNCESATDRVNLTLKASFDGGRTWTYKETVDSLRGGYADTGVDPVSGSIYVFYETGRGERLYLAVFGGIPGAGGVLAAYGADPPDQRRDQN
jgi:sialidase-1